MTLSTISKAQSCGTGTFYQLDTLNWAGLQMPPIRFFDDTGKEYTKQSLTIFPTTNMTCIAGMFFLEFVDDPSASSPFFYDLTLVPTTPSTTFGTTMGEVRRNISCKVFQDLSDFLTDVSGVQGRANIQLNATGTMGVMMASAMMTLPSNSVSPNLVVDNEVMKTIQSGQDSYLQYPVGAIIGNPPPVLHGIIEIMPDPANVLLDYNYDLNTVNLGAAMDANLIRGNADYYSILLHEALHLLGFTSPSASVWHPRYEKFLTYNNPPNFTSYIQQSTPGAWIFSPSPSPLQFCSTDPTISTILFHDFGMVDQETFGNRMHLTCGPSSCSSTFYNTVASPHVMTWCVVAGDNVRRHPSEVEKNILCDLGYTFASNPPYYGVNDPFTGIKHPYQQACTPPCATYTLCDTYIYMGNIPAAIPISPFANDNLLNGGMPAGSTLSQLIVHTPNAGAITNVNLNNNTFDFIPSPNLPCNTWITISYVPVCPNGQDGGTTYIFIYMGQPTIKQTIAGNNFTNGDIIDIEIEICNESDFNMQAIPPATTSWNLQLPPELAALGSTNFLIPPLLAHSCTTFVVQAEIIRPLCTGSQTLTICTTMDNPSGICTPSDCDNVDIIAPIYAATIPNGTVYSSSVLVTSPPPPGSTIAVEGNFIIDQSCLLNDWYFVMLKDIPSNTLGKITVQSMQTLTINHCHFYACDEMWEGIILEGGTGNFVGQETGIDIDANGAFSTTIQDAQYGIYAAHYTSIALKNTLFDRNGVGIFINPYATGLEFSCTIRRIENCTFDCTGATLSDVYPGKAWSYAGIVVNENELHTGISPNWANTFRNMPFGIFGNNSLLIINYDKFENINTDNVWFYGNQPNSVDGSAIVCWSFFGNWALPASLYQTGNGSTGNPTFINCRRAVQAGGQYMGTVSVRANRMVNMKRGVEFVGGNATAFSIDNNYIQCQEYGITINNLPKSPITLSNNTIRLSNPGPAAFSLLTAGISLSNQGSPTRAHIYNNDIQLGNLSYTGIRINSAPGLAPPTQVDGVTIDHNRIKMLSNANNNHTGIDAINSPYIKIRLNGGLNAAGIPNGIYGNWYAGVPYNSNSLAVLGNTSSTLAAISLTACANSLVECNTVDNTPVGLRFLQDCGNSDVKGNKMNRHFYGLYIGQNGSQIGIQTGKANQWNNATNSYILGALNDAVASQSIFQVWDANAYPNPPSVAAFPRVPVNNGNISYFPATWFKNTPTNPFTEFSCPQGYIQSPDEPNEDLSEADYRIANDSTVLDSTYSEETLWTAQRNLYSRLVADSTIIPDTGLVRLFYENRQQSNFRDFEKVNRRRNELWINSSYSTLIDNESQILAYFQTLTEIDSLLNLANSDSLALDSLQQARQFTLGEIHSLLAYSQSLLTGIHNSQAAEANVIATENGLISAAEMYEQNERAVNEIYLTTVPVGIYEFTIEQTNLLESIANQCPVSGGNAVFTARSMLEMVNDAREYPNDSLCATQGIAWRQLHPNVKNIIRENIISIHPNPTKGELTFEFSNPLISNSLLIIRNSLGQIVFSEDIAESSESYNISLSNQPEGLYLYEIRIGSEIQSGKIILSK